MTSQTSITSKTDAARLIRETVELAVTAASKSLETKGSAWAAIAGNRAEIRVSLYGVTIHVQANPATGLAERTFKGYEVRQAVEYMGAQ